MPSIFLSCANLRDRLDELGLIDLIRDLCDDDVELPAVLLLYDLCLCARDHAAAAGNICFLDSLRIIDDAARRKVGAFYELQKILARGVLVVGQI